MIVLLDTNVISQQKAKHPLLAVIDFLNSLPAEQSFLSVLTIMEIRAGIDRLDIGTKKRHALEQWLQEDILGGFSGRLVPVTSSISEVAGKLLASEKKAKRNPSIPDLLIAATASVYGMQIATLNRKHFEPFGVPLIKL